MKRIIFIFIILSLFFVNQVSAVTSLVPNMMQSDGESFAIKGYSKGNTDYLLLSAGGSLNRYNISALDLSTVDWKKAQKDSVVIPTIIRDIVLDGTVVYVIGESQISAVNLTTYTITSNYTNPSNTCYYIHGTIKNKTLYVTTFGKGTSVFSIVDPSNIVYLSSFMPSNTIKNFNRTWGINASDNKLFVGNNFANPPTMDVYDITNESNPIYLSTWKDLTAPAVGYRYISDIQTSNNVTYLVDYYKGIRILNTLTDVPSLLYQFDFDAISLDLINSSTLAVSIRYNTGKIYDVSIPSSPVVLDSKVGSTNSLGYTEDISYNNGNLFINSLTFGAYIFDATDLSNVVEYNTSNAGHIPVAGDIFTMLFYNDALYTGSRNNLLAIFNPSLFLTDIDVSSARFYGLAITNNILYATAATGGIIRADVSEQYKFNNVKQYKVGDAYFDIVIVDNRYLYTLVGAASIGEMGGAGTKLGVFDISNNTIILKKSLNLTNLSAGEPNNGQLKSMVLYNNTTLLFSTQGGETTTNGIYYVDISNRANPTIITRKLSTAGYGKFIYDNVTHLVYAANVSVFEVVNVSNMTFTTIGSVNRKPNNLLSTPCKIGNDVYVSGTYLDKYDVSIPTNPQLKGTFKFIGGSPEVVCSNTDVYAADSWGMYKFIAPYLESPPSNSSLLGDLKIVTQHFGEQTKSPYPSFDIDRNGVVNIFDAIAIAKLLI